MRRIFAGIKCPGFGGNIKKWKGKNKKKRPRPSDTGCEGGMDERGGEDWGDDGRDDWWWESLFPPGGNSGIG